jgi:dihydrofolate synthase/folylpolyglutamate synthase
MGMLATKDHSDVFAALLRPGDALYLVPVPGHETAGPGELAAIARSVCPDLSRCEIYGSLGEGLGAIAASPSQLRVLCGSLYLIGHFLATEPHQDSNPAKVL